MVFSPSLFPDADYAHRLTVKRGDLRAFFAATDEHADIMAERRHWLTASPQHYVAAIDDALPLINETARLLAPDVQLSGHAREDLIAIGCAIEPDIVLLQKTDDNAFRVVAGCVAFPSSWSLPEKVGLSLDQVHSIVPDLNVSLGAPIARFLGKMQPGAVWERSNWGLSAVPDRNQHPTRDVPRLKAPLTADKVWLRVEDQLLALLPQTGGLLFGIRIVRQTLAQLEQHEPEILARLQRAIATMPEEMARYKNIASVRSELVDLLAAQVTAQAVT